MEPHTEIKQHENKQWPQVLATLSACLGNFCAGLCFSWSSPSLVILESPDTPIIITSSDAAWIASLLQLGSALSPFMGAFLTKLFGPKVTILISAIPYLIGFILIALSRNVVELCISRLISGFAVGLSFSTLPIYVSEISESRNRGALMFFLSLSMNMGALFMLSVGPYVSLLTMAQIMVVFPTLMLVSFMFAPESPLYYLRVDKEERALKSLTSLRRQSRDSKDLEEEFYIMKNHSQQGVSVKNCLKEFCTKPNPKALILVFIVIFCQQICGAITSILYQQSIYESVEIPFPANIAVIITALISNIFAIAAMKLVDVWGRKPLLILSSIGCAISDGILGIYFVVTEKKLDIPYISILAAVAVNLLQISFVIGLSPVPFAIAGEIFSSNSREIGLCITASGGAVIGFIVAKLYQIVNDAWGGGIVFLGFMSLTIIFAVFIHIFLPETKRKTFNEIQDSLK